MGAILTKRGILLLALALALVLFLTSSPSRQLASPVLSRYYDWNEHNSNHSLPPPSALSRPSPPSSFSPSLTKAPEPLDSDGSEPEYATYRQKLEAATARFRHSSTLSFDRIYVLSLQKRSDRRLRMSKLALALGLEFTFVDATDKDEPVISWIGERVAEVRAKKALSIAKASGMDLTAIGGGGVTSPWLLGSKTKELALPNLNIELYDGKDWVNFLHSTNAKNLLPSPDFNLTEALHDPLEKNTARQVIPAVISTFYSHTKLMRAIAKEGLASALILEDDVDLEWDIERAWANVERRLPSDWDIAFLGSCWGQETQQPAYLHPALHRSTAPRCLHGYAVSRVGVNKILASLSDPWIAYQAAIDTALPHFITKRVFQSFSLVPPIIIQLKDGPSDIQGGNGSVWRGVLADSTMERIREDEGEEMEPLRFNEDEVRRDPALLYRGVIEPMSSKTINWLSSVKATATGKGKEVKGAAKKPDTGKVAPKGAKVGRVIPARLGTTTTSSSSSTSSTSSSTIAGDAMSTPEANEALRARGREVVGGRKKRMGTRPVAVIG